jgi:hypothetical protein
LQPQLAQRLAQQKEVGPERGSVGLIRRAAFIPLSPRPMRLNHLRRSIVGVAE